MLRLTISSIAALLLMCGSAAKADLVLDLVTSGPTTVTSGSTVNMDLILRDTDNSHFGPSTGTGALGLLSGGGKLIQSGATGSGAAVVTATTVGADFFMTTPQTAQLQAPGLGGALSAISLFPPPLPAGISSGVAHIATFAATITGGVGDMVTISADTLGLVAPAGPGSVVGNRVFGTSTNLDAVLGSFATPGTGASFGSLTFEVAAIPEPSTLLVAVLLACGGGVYWMRRRNSVGNQTTRTAA